MISRTSSIGDKVGMEMDSLGSRLVSLCIGCLLCTGISSCFDPAQGFSGNGSTGRRCGPDETCFTIPYALYGDYTVQESSKYNRLPFPYDYFTVQDELSRTGLRLSLRRPRSDKYPYGNSRVIDEGLLLFFPDETLAALSILDGFSLSGPISFETGVELDVSTIQDGVALYALDRDADPVGLDFYASTGFACRESVDPECRKGFHYLTIRPKALLEPSASYAVVVTKHLAAADGRRALMSDHFAQVFGMEDVSGELGAAERSRERSRLAWLKERLSHVMDLDEVVMAFDFTTQSTRTDLDYLVRDYLDSIQTAMPDLDWDRDGRLNFYEPDQYPSHLPGLPSFDAGDVSYVVSAELEIPEFRNLEHGKASDPKFGAFVYDEMGRPSPTGTNKVHLYLFYPVQPKQPMPLVCVQHGVDNSAQGMGRLVGPVVEAGAAVVMFDLTYHGTRKEDGQGSPALEFFDINHLSKASGALKQSVFEQAYVLRAFGSNGIDIFPDATGDGVADFDPGRIGLIGTSLGSIISETTSALSKDVSAAVFNVGAAGLGMFVSSLVQDYGLSNLLPEYLLEQTASIVQILLDQGDPASYTGLLKERHASGEVAFLFQQAMEDGTIPKRCTERFAVLAGMDQVEPVQEKIEGLEALPAPYYGGKGIFQFPDSGHGFLFGGSKQGVAGREQVEKFFDTFFTRGRAVVYAAK